MATCNDQTEESRLREAQKQITIVADGLDGRDDVEADLRFLADELDRLAVQVPG